MKDEFIPYAKEEIERFRKLVLKEEKWEVSDINRFGKSMIDNRNWSEQAKAIIRSQKLDSVESIRKAAFLLRYTLEAIKWTVEENRSLDFFIDDNLKELEKVLKASAGTDLYKFKEALKEAGNYCWLTDSYYLLKKESQKNKEQILGNLDEWSMEFSYFTTGVIDDQYWGGKHYPSRFQTKVKELKKIEYKCFSEKDYQEIKKVIINKVKQNPQKWKIEKVIWWVDKDEGEIYSEHEVLRSVENPAPAYYWSKFTEEEWKEIKKLLRNSKKAVEQKSQSKSFLKDFGFLIVGGVVLLLLLLGLLLYKKSKTKN